LEKQKSSTFHKFLCIFSEKYVINMKALIFILDKNSFQIFCMHCHETISLAINFREENKEKKEKHGKMVQY